VEHHVYILSCKDENIGMCIFVLEDRNDDEDKKAFFFKI